MSKNPYPVRMCSGCRQRRPKSELIRIVRSPEGEIFLDTTGRKNGRGAYICKNADCFLKALKKKAFDRAFGVGLPDDLAETIREELK